MWLEYLMPESMIGQSAEKGKETLPSDVIPGAWQQLNDQHLLQKSGEFIPAGRLL